MDGSFGPKLLIMLSFHGLGWAVSNAHCVAPHTIQHSVRERLGTKRHLQLHTPINLFLQELAIPQNNSTVYIIWQSSQQLRDIAVPSLPT